MTALGDLFRDAALLDAALTHASHAHEQGGPDNERLEFLGDAVLQAAVTAALYARHPDAEGRLTDRRQRIVNTVVLAEVGRALALGPLLRLGKGEEQSGGRDKDTVLAGAVEAVLGALFLDQGYDAASGWIIGVLEPWLARSEPAAEAPDERFNPKSRLQELTQGRGLGAPAYAVIGQDGPPHAPTFHVEVRVDGDVVGAGSGGKKAAAERAAAQDALARLGQ